MKRYRNAETSPKGSHLYFLSLFSTLIVSMQSTLLAVALIRDTVTQ